MLDDYFKAGVLETPFEYMDEGEGRWMISWMKLKSFLQMNRLDATPLLHMRIYNLQK